MFIYVILIVFSTVLWAMALLINPGYSAVLLATSASMMLSGALFGITLHLERSLVAYKAFAFFFVLQPFFFFVVLVMFPDEVVEHTANSGIFDKRPIGLFYSFCLVPLLACLFSRVLSLNKSQGTRDLKFYLRLSEGRLDFLLIFAALINVSIWVITLYGGPLTYFLRILHKSLYVAPFFAGLYLKQSRSVTIAWTTSIGMSLCLAFLTGSRGYAFFPLAFYGVGVLAQAERGRDRRFWFTVAAVVVPIAVLSAGLISGIRDELGRKSVAEVNVGEFFEVVGDVASKAFEGDYYAGKNLRDSALWSGTTRLVDWAALYAPTMSPDPVAYRGYNDFSREILGQFVWFGFGGGEGRAYASRLFARMYGFGSYYELGYEGKLKSHTVPFNILADSWSRFGAISSIVQVSIALLFFLAFEIFNRRLFRRYPELMVLGLIVILAISFKYITTYTLLESMRGLVLQYAFTMLVVYVINISWRRFMPLRLNHNTG